MTTSVTMTVMTSNNSGNKILIVVTKTVATAMVAISTTMGKTQLQLWPMVVMSDSNEKDCTDDHKQ